MSDVLRVCRRSPGRLTPRSLRSLQIVAGINPISEEAMMRAQAVTRLHRLGLAMCHHRTLSTSTQLSDILKAAKEKGIVLDGELTVSYFPFISYYVRIMMFLSCWQLHP